MRRFVDGLKMKNKHFENMSEPDSTSDQAEIPENFPDGTPDGFTICLLDTNKRILYVYEPVR